MGRGCASLPLTQRCHHLQDAGRTLSKKGGSAGNHWQLERGRGVNNLFNWLWILFFIWSFMPLLQQRRLAMVRLRILREIERQRGSRVITMIHRQEGISFLGIPVSRFINIEDSEAVLRAIRFTPPDMPIDILLHTPGGLVLASEQIARAIQKHKAPVSVFIPHYAMSGGTLIALAADEIFMDENAVLGPVDPQLGNLPAVSIIKAVEEKGAEKADDQTLILRDVAVKAIQQMYEVVRELLKDRMEPEEADRVARVLTHGKWTHDYPITCEQLATLGITVNCQMPREIYLLMDLYPQPPSRRPTVQYIPVPYGRDAEPGPRR